MVHSRKKDKWIVYILAILLCLVLVSFWLMCNMYAKYTSQASGSDSARVAIFGHNESIDIANFPQNWKPGTSYTFKLQISNQKNGKISEVAQKYDIEVVTQGNLPLVYILKNAGGSQIDKFTETSNEKNYRFTNNSMEFQGGKSAEDKYELIIQWPEDKKNAEFVGIPDSVQIKINVQQID